MSDGILVLGDGNASLGVSGAHGLRNRCAFTSRDMGAEWPDAFTYGIVLGWDEALDEIAAKHHWDAELVAFVKDAHERFSGLSDQGVRS